LLTTFLGGATKPEVFDWPDQRVWDVVCSEVKQVLNAESHRIQLRCSAIVAPSRNTPSDIGNALMYSGMN
jgi:hypothetical protein